MEHHVPSIRWHTVLNNHASTRPKAHGGPLVRAVTSCNTFTAPGSASVDWHCSLELPHSFAPGDNRVLQTEGSGPTKEEASEQACFHAVAALIATLLSECVLRPARWKISPDALLQGLPGCEGQRQALPVHVPRRLLNAAAESAAPDAEARVATLVRNCLTSHGGEFDPSRIRHRNFVDWGFLNEDDDKAYSQLNSWLEQIQLRQFIDSHVEFDWKPNGYGMIITWALNAAPSSASAAVADADGEAVEPIGQDPPSSAS